MRGGHGDPVQGARRPGRLRRRRPRPLRLPAHPRPRLRVHHGARAGRGRARRWRPSTSCATSRSGARGCTPWWPAWWRAPASWATRCCPPTRPWSGVLIGEAAAALAVGASLRARAGLGAGHPAAVGAGRARRGMRLTVMATHEDRHIDWALGALAGARLAGGRADARRAGHLRDGHRHRGRQDRRGAAAIALAARAQGRTVAPLKPAQTGDDGTASPATRSSSPAVLGLDEPVEAICPYALRAPLAPGRGGARSRACGSTPASWSRAYEDLASRYDLVVVEAAGGRARALLRRRRHGRARGPARPARGRRRPARASGTLNHTLLTLEASTAAG